MDVKTITSMPLDVSMVILKQYKRSGESWERGSLNCLSPAVLPAVTGQKTILSTLKQYYFEGGQTAPVKEGSQQREDTVMDSGCCGSVGTA